MTYGRSVVFCEYKCTSVSFTNKAERPQYNWNIVESGIYYQIPPEHTILGLPVKAVSNSLN